MEKKLLIQQLINDKIIKREGDFAVIDLKDISEYSLEANEYFEQEPKKFVETVKSLFLDLFGADIFIRIKNAYNNLNISNIRKEELGKIVSVKGIVAKMTKPLLSVKYRDFECPACGAVIKIMSSKIPTRCTCGSRRLNEIHTEFEDMQEVEIEEIHEEIDGKQPEKIRIVIKGRLTNPEFNGILQPGNKVEFIGIIEKVIIAKNKLQEDIFEFYIDTLDYHSLEEQFNDELISKEDERQILEIASNNPLNTLKSSLAPSIFGYEEIKKALVLQMVGGVKRELAGKNISRDRIHILLAGDGGISKTTLARNVKVRMPKSYYVSGDESTKAGVVAAVEKDEMSGAWSVRAGAICKANSSIAIIDEADKMNKQDREALHTPMESGEVYVSKAGIQAKLKADCSILMILNPKNGIFEDDGKSLVKQINLPPTLLGRFDLMFVMRDKIDEKYDKNVVNLIFNNNTKEAEIDISMFRKYIAYAKKIKPDISPELEEKIHKFYSDVRKKSLDREAGLRGVPIGPRQIFGLIRLSEAAAKIRLSEKVEEEDFKIAKDLFYSCLIDLGLNEDGIIDLARFSGGKTLSKRKKSEFLLEKMRILFSEGTKEVKDRDLELIMKEAGMSSGDYEKTIDELNREGSVLKKGDSWVLL